MRQRFASSFLPGHPGSAQWTLVPLRFYLVTQEVPGGRWCLFVSTWSPRKCPVDAGASSFLPGHPGSAQWTLVSTYTSYMAPVTEEEKGNVSKRPVLSNRDSISYLHTVSPTVNFMVNNPHISTYLALLVLF